MWTRLFRRRKGLALREEHTWHEFFERSKAKLFTLLRCAKGSTEEAEQAFQKVFVLYAKECIAHEERPCVSGVLRRAVQWLRDQQPAPEFNKSDGRSPIQLVPLELKLAHLISHTLSCSPKEAEEILEEPREQIWGRARAAVSVLDELIKNQPVRT